MAKKNIANIIITEKMRFLPYSFRFMILYTDEECDGIKVELPHS